MLAKSAALEAAADLDDDAANDDNAKKKTKKKKGGKNSKGEEEEEEEGAGHKPKDLHEAMSGTPTNPVQARLTALRRLTSQRSLTSFHVIRLLASGLFPKPGHRVELAVTCFHALKAGPHPSIHTTTFTTAFELVCFELTLPTRRRVCRCHAVIGWRDDNQPKY